MLAQLAAGRWVGRCRHRGAASWSCAFLLALAYAEGWPDLVGWRRAKWAVGGLSCMCAPLSGSVVWTPVGGLSRDRVGYRRGVSRSVLPVGGHLFDAKQLAQNWHGPGESDCLIKTKHCDVC